MPKHRAAVQALSGVVLTPATNNLARAADETITQTGTVAIDNVTGNPYHSLFPPKDVFFKEEFGGTPNITISYPKRGHKILPPGYLQESVTNITSEGFRISSSFPSGTYVDFNWTAVGPKLNWGTVTPSYLVLTVFYSPPGSASGHGTSSVTYEMDSTAGTTTSASTTFKSDVSSSVDTSGKVWGVGSGSGTGFETSHSLSYSDSMDIRKTKSTTHTLNGPIDKDEINHDEDEIWLLLKPTVKLGLSSLIAKWMLGETRSPAQPVRAGELNNHLKMSDGTAKWLNWAGITPSDYPCILARDPLAAQADGITAKDYPCLRALQTDGKSPFESGRFTPLNQTFAYKPLDSSGASSEQGYKLSSSETRTITTEIEDTYTVKATETPIDANFGSYYSAKVNDTSSWGWTNKSTSSTVKGNTQIAQLTVRNPSSTYSGSTVLDVYFDTIYNTFAFAIRPIDTREVALQGQLLTKTGESAAYRPITMIDGERKYTTLTNSKGEFTFYGDMSGSVVLQADGVNQRIPQLRATRSIRLRPK
jgi:hypothetical protein